MEVRINKLAQDCEIKDQDVETLKLQCESFAQMGATYDKDARTKLTRMKKTYESALKAARDSDKVLSDQRYEITSKETELLLIFRELMTFDFYVADHFFDREQLLRKKEKK